MPGSSRGLRGLNRIIRVIRGSRLEEDFDSELTDSWIQGISQRAECPLVQVCHTVHHAAGGIFEIHAIEDVEKLSAELHAISLTGFDVLEKSHIPVVIAGPSQAPLTDVAERADGRLRKNAHVEVIHTRCRRAAGAASIRIAIHTETTISSQPRLRHIGTRA